MNDGDEQSWDAEQYEGSHEYVYEYGRDVLALLDPAAGERILDLGCGTGHLTAEIATAVGDEGSVVGIDSSPDMIDRARETHPDVEFAVADATEFEPGEPFDAVFSNAALHWITERSAVTERVADVLRPGGRYVAEFGGTGNVDAIVGALRDALEARGYDAERSWYFPAIGEHTSLLERHGFETQYARLFDRPTDLDGGADGLRTWIETFGETLLSDLAPSERAAVLQAVEDQLRPDRYDPETETWTADYRRLRFVAVRRA